MVKVCAPKSQNASQFAAGCGGTFAPSANLRSLPRKPIELPPAVARAFVTAFKAFTRRLIVLNTVGDDHMSDAEILRRKAEMFERRAETATDPISKQHYREMAAHYRQLLVEHLDVRPEPHESAE